jgi:hypothetical protein
MKKTAVEWLIEKREKEGTLHFSDFSQAKEMENQQQGYSEEEFLAFGKSCFYKGFEKAENDDANCFTAFREEIGGLFNQFKNK